MIITLRKDAPQSEIDSLINQFEKEGLQVNIIHGDNFNVFGLSASLFRFVVHLSLM